MVESIASEVGAMFINLSPKNLEEKYTTKEEPPSKLLHMIWSIATDQTKCPVVIYIDEAEKFFAGGKKKAADGPSRFKKDLLTYMKALSPYDNVIVIGNSREPYTLESEKEQKELKEVFDKFLYIPWPDYPACLNLWSTKIKAKLKQNIPDDFDVYTLARISHG